MEFVEFILKTQANKIFFVMQAPWMWGEEGPDLMMPRCLASVVHTPRGLVCVKDWKQTLLAALVPSFP